MARGLKFRIKEVEELYYPCSENKGADHREADLRLCFRICEIRFSHDDAPFFNLIPTPFLLYVRCKFGVTFVRRCFRDVLIIYRQFVSGIIALQFCDVTFNSMTFSPILIFNGYHL